VGGDNDGGDYRKLTQEELEEYTSLGEEMIQLKSEFREYLQKYYQACQSMKKENRKTRVDCRDDIQRWKVNKAHAKRDGLPENMSKKMINYCRGNGGCCIRGCGCCSRPRATTLFEGDHYAHCTEDCGCCYKFYHSI
jgi:hypothetical protein